MSNPPGVVACGATGPCTDLPSRHWSYSVHASWRCNGEEGEGGGWAHTAHGKLEPVCLTVATIVHTATASDDLPTPMRSPMAGKAVEGKATAGACDEEEEAHAWFDLELSDFCGMYACFGFRVGAWSCQCMVWWGVPVR